VIGYDAARGDPRGSRSKKVDPRAAGLGDCIDCEICVQVCPTGIDIRKGLQYECIGCAACIDGCNQVMDKMGYSRGLIRYASQNSLARRWDKRALVRHMARPRTLVYLTALVSIATAAGVSLALKNPLKVDIIRDRGALAREAKPGTIENSYRMQVMNTAEESRSFTIEAVGLPGLIVVGIEQPLAVDPAATRLAPFRLQAPVDAAAPGSHKIELIVRATNDADSTRREQSTFIFPR
jgi:cytochrome c oxidase accessory protein FixG